MITWTAPTFLINESCWQLCLGFDTSICSFVISVQYISIINSVLYVCVCVHVYTYVYFTCLTVPCVCIQIYLKCNASDKANLQGLCFSLKRKTLGRLIKLSITGISVDKFLWKFQERKVHQWLLATEPPSSEAEYNRIPAGSKS